MQKLVIPYRPTQKEYWMGKAIQFAQRHLEKSVLNPKRAQAKALKTILKNNRKSEVGRDLRLDQVRNLEDLRHLPISTQETMQPYYERILKLGSKGQGILGTSPLVALMRTTGTTAAPKHIPANKDYLKAYYRSRFYTFAALAKVAPRDWTKILDCPSLVVSSSPKVDEAPGGIPIGFGSGVLNEISKPFGKHASLPSRETSSISDWNQKMAAIYDEAITKDVGAIIGFPRYVEDLTDFVLARSGKAHLREIWPNLTFMVTGAVKITETFKHKIAKQWGGPSAAFGQDLHLVDVFSATEAQFGMTWDEASGGILLNPLDVVYQFRNPDTGAISQLHEIEARKTYELLITTPGGLVNYSLGDLLTFKSARPAVFEFAGRVRDEISLAGEKITPGNVEKALELLLKEKGISIVDFALWIEAEPRRIRWILPEEIRKQADSIGLIEALPGLLDQSLAQTAIYYGTLLKDGFYQPSQIEWVEGSLFKNYRAQNAHRGQFKGKRLFTSEQSFKDEYKRV